MSSSKGNSTKGRGGAPVHERTERKRVRRAELVSADGTSEVALLVPCRSLGRDVALDVCSACAKCRSMPEDPSLDGAEVVCRVDPAMASGPRLKELDMVEAALRTPLGEVVSADALALEEDVTMEVAGRLAREHGLTAIAVVSSDKKPVAVLTWSELVTNDDGKARVGDCARPLASAYAIDGPLLHALPAVSDGAVGYAIVVGNDGVFYGLLTAADVARWLARRAGYEV
jgi:CBS domain-containing protein